MIITTKLLKSWNACTDGRKRFKAFYPNGVEFETLMGALSADGKKEWRDWLASVVAGRETDESLLARLTKDKDMRVWKMGILGIHRQIREGNLGQKGDQMTKINLDRCRKEYPRPRRFVGKTILVNIFLPPDDKSLLAREAAERGYSFSLYVNLILHGQEKSPLKRRKNEKNIS